MTRSVLLTLGRLPKALDIARAFHAAGWRVVVAEPFRRHLTGASRAVAACFQVTAPAVDRQAYLAELAAIIARENITLVIPVSEETMHVAFLREILPPDVELFTMPPALVLEMHDKARFIARAESLGLAVPPTHALGTAAASAMAQTTDVVVKPIFSCSGIGVRIIRAGTELPWPGTQPCIVQRFAPGIVHSNCAIARNGRVIANAIYRGTLMSGSVAVAFERVENAAIKAWITQFVAALGWTGFISFDFVVAENGFVQAIECNPRATSGLHFLRPEDIVAAITAPGALTRAGFRPERELQQFYAALTATQASLLRLAPFRRNVRAMRRARDVTWRRDDPWPFLGMTFTTWPIIAMALRRGVPMGEVATLDIGWYGDG